jgi:altronate dehydratase
MQALEMAADTGYYAKMSDTTEHAHQAVYQNPLPWSVAGGIATMLDLVLATASGRPTRAELNGEREIAIWKTGAPL